MDLNKLQGVSPRLLISSQSTYTNYKDLYK